MNILTVVNPISGGKDKSGILDYIRTQVKQFGHNLSLYETDGKKDQEKIDEAINEFKPDRIAVIGGDGTFLMVAEVIGDRNIPVGIIPMGSANGLASELNIPKNPEEAFDLFLKSDLIASLDTLCINGKWRSLHLGDIGLNAEIVKGFDKDESRGMMAYTRQVIKALSNATPIKFVIREKGEVVRKGEAVMLGIGNGRKYGTGIPLSQHGNPMDGKFELVIIEEVRAGSLLKQSLSALDDAFFDATDNEEFHFTSCEIEFEQPQTLQLDGEVKGDVEKLNIEIEPGKIKLITDNSNPYLPAK